MGEGENCGGGGGQAGAKQKLVAGSKDNTEKDRTTIRCSERQRAKGTRTPGTGTVRYANGGGQLMTALLT